MTRITFIISLALLALAPPVVNSHAAMIALGGEADVASAVVRLGDIATITGSEPPEQMERIRSIAICSAPPPAEIQILGLNTVISAIRISGVDLSQLKLAGPAQVLVRRRYNLVSVQDLQRVFVEHVYERTGWRRDSFLVRPPKNLREIPVPVGERDITVETFPDEDFRGSVLAHFQIMIDGSLYRILAHRFTVERYVEALVTTRKILRGEQVTASDAEVMKMEQSQVSEGSFTRMEQAAGLMAIRTIRPGMVLNGDILTASPVVQKGEFAPVICEGNGFHILTRGRVLENGCSDDVVRVRLPTKKIVKAVVLDSKKLRIIRQGEGNEWLR